MVDRASRRGPQPDGSAEQALLLGRLREHLMLVRTAATANEFVDLAVAEQLHARLATLVGSFDALDGEQRQVLRDAVSYLVRVDDEEDDLRSPIGFDDDAVVIEAALSRLPG